MAVVLADLLDEHRIVPALQARTRDAALREIVATMESGVRPGALPQFLEAVRAREEVQTTLMGNGIAFPHTRTDLVQEIVLGMGRSAEGVPFGENGEAAHLIFLIGVPTRMVNDYLVCVGALARLTKVEAMRAALMRAETAAEFAQLLRDGSLLLE